ACGVRRSTATSILQRMEQNGLVVREGVPTDARLKKITLTEKALQLHRQVETAFDTLEETLRGALTEEELRCFFSVLNKIQKEVEADDPTAQSMHPGI
ncbi:MAG: MarR family transcriptional regulator, partial [Clostridia bacterium]|nr:MarR family transcriptional regulator [Clostridia bacterium]